MARRPNYEKHLLVNEEVLKRLEGFLQALRDMDSRARPRLLPADYIANQLNVGRGTVKAWLKAAKDTSRMPADQADKFERFAEIHSAFGCVLGQQIEDAVWKAAADPDNRNGMKAALWLLPKIRPDVFGKQADAEEVERKGETFAGVPQEVFDELTPEQIEELERLQAQLVEIQARTDAIVKEGMRALAVRQADEARARVH